jgi:hypothetical protein
MCYSYRTSIISYTLGMLAAIFALFTRQYILGTLILFYCQMQLSEAIIWKGIDEDNPSLNKAGTKYGKYLLPTHLFAVGLGYIISIVLLKKRALRNEDFIPMAIGIAFYVAIMLGPYRCNNYKDETYPANRDKSCQNNGNRLRWQYPHSWYVSGFLICLLFIVFYVRPINSGVFIFASFVISFIVSSRIYPKSVGSFWCFTAAILAPILVLVNYLIIRQLPDSKIVT